MTPEERKGALVGLLGRLRTNAGSRLPSRSGDEEEFVPKSVIAARAAAAETAAAQLDASRRAALDDAMDGDLLGGAARPRFAPDDVPLETDPPPTAVPGSTPGTLEEALRQAEQAEIERERAEAAAASAEPRMESAPPTPRSEVDGEAPSIEVGDSSELELDLFDPFDEATATGAPDEIEADALESAPPPAPPPPVPPPRVAAQPPPAPPASLTRAIAMRSSPTIESPAVSPPPAPVAAKLVPPPSPSASGSSTKQAPLPARPKAATADAAPPKVSPVVSPKVEPRPLSVELPFDEQTEERNDVAAQAAAEEVRISEDDLESTVNMPPRKADPLAQTAQNPIPAAFERAVLRAEGALVPPLDAPKTDAPEVDAAASPTPQLGSPAEADEPVSSKQPRALDRDGDELDDGLQVEDGLRVDDGDEPPQSGEIASQRQPSTGQHAPDLDLDGATPPSDQADAVADEAMALLDAEAVPSAPPATRPAVMGRRPVAVTSFLDVLDDALSLGE